MSTLPHDWSADTLRDGRSGNVPYRQFDPGTFEVVKRPSPGGTPAVVGHLYVVSTGSNTVVEHWAFEQAYQSPSGTEAVEVKRLSTGYTSLASFLSAMRSLQPEAYPFKYIVAECTNYSTLPE